MTLFLNVVWNREKKKQKQKKKNQGIVDNINLPFIRMKIFHSRCELQEPTTNLIKIFVTKVRTSLNPL